MVTIVTLNGLTKTCTVCACKRALKGNIRDLLAGPTEGASKTIYWLSQIELIQTCICVDILGPFIDCGSQTKFHILLLVNPCLGKANFDIMCDYSAKSVWLDNLNSKDSSYKLNIL